MESPNKHQYLKFTIQALSALNMWPQERVHCCSIIQQNYVFIIITITTFPVLAEVLSQLSEEEFSLDSVIKAMIGLTALYGVLYICICFMRKKHEIKTLVEDLCNFEQFSPMPLILEAETSAKFYTKFFMAYGIIGNVTYAIVPFLNYYDCETKKSRHMRKYGIPCGMIAELLLPFKYDYSPWAEIIIFEEMVVCLCGTTIIMTITMLICGVLIHTTTHLKYLNSLILGLSHAEGEELQEKVLFCLKFHCAIIKFSERVDASFRQMMLLHITWTGFIISILGFQIIVTTNFVEASRFILHLSGWLGMLFIVCYYGQTLMDESSAITKAAYFFAWYNKPVAIQKSFILVLLRSQKPLTITASGLKVMSLATFLGILYSAYSYFTLLLKFKS